MKILLLGKNGQVGWERQRGLAPLGSSEGDEISLMEKVVTTASGLVQSGDTVLMAPACASMDQFISYADRGDQFATAVQKIVMT